MKHILFSVVLLSSFMVMAAEPKKAAATADANVAGAWDLTLQAPQGARTSSLELKQEGTKLTGTHKGQRGDSPVTGSVNGNSVTFVVSVSMQGQSMNITYTGEFDGKDGMKGKVLMGSMGEATWTATRKTK